MPNQTQTASIPSSLDQGAVNLAKAIRQTESGGNFTAKGKSGEYGAYQYTEPTWAKDSAAAGVNVPLSQATPEQQNEVAYKKIKSLKDQGHNVGQIASIWNSGKPDAYLDTSYKGVNKSGASYDVPAYARSVATAYQTLKGGGQVQADPNNPSSTANTTPLQPPQDQGQNFAQKALGTAGKVANFFLPVLGDIGAAAQGKTDKSALQIAGDVGLSGLSLIPGLGEAGLGLRGLGLAAKGAEAGIEGANVASKAGLLSKAIANPITRNAGIGYGADVSSKLASGETDPTKVLTPGLGTATGGLLGAGSAGLSKIGPSLGSKWVNSLIKPLQKDFAYGKNPGRAVTAEGIVANNLDEYGNKVGQRADEVGKEIGQLGKQLNEAKVYEPITPGGKPVILPFSVNVAPSLSPLDTALEEAARTNNSAVFNRLQEVKQALTNKLGTITGEQGISIGSKGTRNLDNMSYSEAQELKQLISSMTRWTRNPSDDKLVNATLQRVYGNIAETMKKRVETVPGIGKALRDKLEALNERYGDLKSAEIAIKYREAINGRQNLISLGDKIMGGAGAVSGLLTGGPVGAGIMGMAGTGISHALGSTAAKSRIGSSLARIGGAKSVIPGLLKQPNKTKDVLKGLLKTSVIRGGASVGQ